MLLELNGIQAGPVENPAIQSWSIHPKVGDNISYMFLKASSRSRVVVDLDFRPVFLGIPGGRNKLTGYLLVFVDISSLHQFLFTVSPHVFRAASTSPQPGTDKEATLQ